jgi:acyl carrier protein
MTLDTDTALAAIRNAIAEINLSRPGDQQLSDDPDAVLFGEGSDLDSLGLVNVVIAAEQHVADVTGVDIVLASEAAMSRKRSPYRNLRALAEYAVEVHTAQQAAE